MLLAVAASLGVAAVDQDVQAQISQYTCSTTANYTDGSQYEQNLDSLVSTLSTTAAAGNGDDGWFHSGSAGGAPYQAWGLIMCYADCNATQCQDCLQKAAAVREEMCPHSRSMSVNYDGCLLRYADASFLGAADTGDWLYTWVLAYATDAASMNETRWRLMSTLAEKAGDEPLRWMSGGERYTDVRGEEQVLYGLAQCTRDLAPGECAGCLKHALAEVSEKEGMRSSTKASVKGYSCYLRYQLNDPFDVAVARPQLQAAGAAPPPGSNGRKTPVIAALAAAAGTVAVLLVAGV
ncbi:hypothetical protein BAE44_0000731 [Dichanthelium oligosanthes]|uniref:Gnk2-homologous domain-containing protein n=1 Tax=Dichanthelium oligosanthes TaxID=888268 RepID=A0A1E5WM96_9POAL|nr:hypothetical protein BAE44_0000731 [Dichanthelium oligosanthes]